MASTLQQQAQVLEAWFTSVGLPTHLQERLRQKIIHDVLDCGSSFVLAQVEDDEAVEAEEEEEVGGQSRVETQGNSATSAPSDGLPASSTGSRPRGLGRGGVAVGAGSLGSDLDRFHQSQRDGIRAQRSTTSLSSYGGGGGAGDEEEEGGGHSHQQQQQQQQPEHDHRGDENAQQATPVKPGYVLVAARDLNAYDDVWLVEHAFTFPVPADLRPVLRESPAFLQRLEAMLALPSSQEMSDAALAAAADSRGGERGAQRFPPTFTDDDAVERAAQSIWRQVNFYRWVQQEPSGATEEDTVYSGGGGGAGGGSSRGVSPASGGAGSAGARRSHERDSVPIATACYGFIHDEVGSAIQPVTGSGADEEEGANMRLVALPVFFPEKGCMFSVLWCTSDVPAGTICGRRVMHRWQNDSGPEVTDVLYSNRSSATFEQSLETCVRCWRESFATAAVNRALVYGMQVASKGLPLQFPYPAGGGADIAVEESRNSLASAMSKLAAQCSAASTHNGDNNHSTGEVQPVTLYCDNPAVLHHLTARDQLLSPLLKKASLPGDAHVVWQMHRTPRSLRQLSVHTALVFWLPQDDAFLPFERLVRLLRAKVGGRPWTPVVYDGVHELKEFIGDFLTRELAADWELHSTRCLLEAGSSGNRAAVGADPLEEQKRVLAHADCANLWCVQHTAAPLVATATGADEADEEGTNGREPAAQSATAAGGCAAQDGSLDDAAEATLLVSDNLEALLKITEAAKTMLRKVYPSPCLLMREFNRLCGVIPESANMRYAFPRFGDRAPLLQFIVLVSQDKVSAQNGDETGTVQPQSLPSTRSTLSAAVHHIVAVRTVEHSQYGVRGADGEGVGVCLYAPLHAMGGSGGDPSSSSTSASASEAMCTLPEYVHQYISTNPETAHLQVTNLAPSSFGGSTDGGDGNGNGSGEDLLTRCHALLTELFDVIKADYEARVAGENPPSTCDGTPDDSREAASKRRRHVAVYGVNVALSFSPLRATASQTLSPQLTTEVQPVLWGITRHADLLAVGQLYPGLYRDIFTTLALGIPSNVSRIA